MEIKLPESIDVEDLGGLSLGLYNAAKEAATKGLEPQNGAEFTLSEHANEIFGTYLQGMRENMLRLTENE